MERIADAMLDQHARLFVTELALVTLVKTLPPETQEVFMAAFLQNVETFADQALATTNPEAWIEKLPVHAFRLQRLIEG